jgi:hypothetical protein
MQDNNDRANDGTFRKWVDVPVSGSCDDSVLAVFKEPVSSSESQICGNYSRFKECRAGYLKSAFNGNTVAYADHRQLSPRAAVTLRVDNSTTSAHCIEHRSRRRRSRRINSHMGSLPRIGDLDLFED